MHSLRTLLQLLYYVKIYQLKLTYSLMDHQDLIQVLQLLAIFANQMITEHFLKEDGVLVIKLIMKLNFVHCLGDYWIVF